jgi:hypothetical protein
MSTKTFKKVTAEDIAGRREKQARRFVVGYAGNYQDAVYSKCAWAHADRTGGISPMTLLQAKRAMKLLASAGSRAYIYELVPAFETIIQYEAS